MASPKIASSTSNAPTETPTAQGNLPWCAAVNVLIPRPSEVMAYLDQHRDLARLLPDICAQVRSAFGQDTELSLEVYRDPEIDDRYLTLYVRQQNYDAEIMERIETVSSRFRASLPPVSGHFLLATDLRRPRGLHAV